MNFACFITFATIKNFLIVANVIKYAKFISSLDFTIILNIWVKKVLIVPNVIKHGVLLKFVAIKKKNATMWTCLEIQDIKAVKNLELEFKEAYNREK